MLEDSVLKARYNHVLIHSILGLLELVECYGTEDNHYDIQERDPLLFYH